MNGADAKRGVALGVPRRVVVQDAQGKVPQPLGGLSGSSDLRTKRRKEAGWCGERESERDKRRKKRRKEERCGACGARQLYVDLCMNVSEDRGKGR